MASEHHVVLAELEPDGTADSAAVGANNAAEASDLNVRERKLSALVHKEDDVELCIAFSSLKELVATKHLKVSGVSTIEPFLCYCRQTEHTTCQVRFCN